MATENVAENTAPVEDEQPVALTVLNPAVDNLEKVGYITLDKVEDITDKTVAWVGNKSEELCVKAVSHHKTEQLKELGQKSVHIGTGSFHRLGDIVNQFANLSQDTADQLYTVGAQAGNLMCEGTDAGQKVKKLVSDTILLIEDTTEKMSSMSGEVAETYFVGTRTEEERCLLLKDGPPGVKGQFHIPLRVLVQRDSAEGQPQVPRIVGLITQALLAEKNIASVFSREQTSEDETAVDELKKRFEEADDADFNSNDDSFHIYQLLLAFFRELPQPLLLTRSYTPLVHAGAESDKESLSDIARVLAELPLEHSIVLDHMIEFATRLKKSGVDTLDTARDFASVFVRPPPGVAVKREEAALHSGFLVTALTRCITKQKEISRESEVYRKAAETRAQLRGSDRQARNASSMFLAALTKTEAEKPLAIQEAINEWAAALDQKKAILGDTPNPGVADILGNLVVAHNVVGDHAAAQEYNVQLSKMARDLAN